MTREKPRKARVAINTAVVAMWVIVSLAVVPERMLPYGVLWLIGYFAVLYPASDAPGDQLEAVGWL